MKTRAVAGAIVITLLSGAAAQAYEPFEDEWLSLPPPPVAPTPDPVAFVVPADLYYVTDTYVADVVTTSDAITTYSTTTVHESTGTYARVIDVIDTGAPSAFDGLAFNGRGALTDGRALAGTYYENFVLTASGYVPVSIVFFQDDAESRRRQTASFPGSPTITASVASKPASTTEPLTPASTSTPVAGPPGARSSSTQPTARETPSAPVGLVRPTLRAGVALAPAGPVLASAEVLRGRLVQFWPRAFANDVAVPLRSWRLISAEPDRVSATAGSIEPLAAQWLRMPGPDTHWSLHFEVFTELAPTERLVAEITITVRSPALVD